MHVHQFGLFLIAVFVEGGGVLLLGMSLLTLLKTKRLTDYQDKKMLLSACLFILYGTWYASRAFDLPHQESHRTSLIGWVLLPCVAIAMTLALLLKRSKRNARYSEQASDEAKPPTV